MAVDLSKVSNRERLKAQREPHWHCLRAGCYVGFRPSTMGRKGTWIARAYDEDKRRYSSKSLGDFGTLPAQAMFAAAKQATEAFAEVIETGGEARPKIQTVRDACEDYAKTRPEAASRFKRNVYETPLAKVRLGKLRKRHLEDWRKALEAKPALVSRNKGGETRTRKRAPSSINRDMAVLRAALSQFVAPGTPKTEGAWQEALKAIPNADGRRTLYLDEAQRVRLIKAASAEIAPFIRAMCLLPLRPGALSKLTVADFDKRTSELTIGQDKNGKPRRIKLQPQAVALFTAQATRKLPAAPLFMRDNGKAWDKNTWKVAIRQAAKAAKLPSETTAYTLRHCTITDLVRRNLPLLTIAQISGTSAEMIERHYGHLTSDAAVEALATLAF